MDASQYYLIINRNPFFLSFDDGVKQTNLRNQDVLDCALVIPNSLGEQKAIADTILDMAKEIETLESKRAKYEQIKQGMMHELLTGKTRLV